MVVLVVDVVVVEEAVMCSYGCGGSCQCGGGVIDVVVVVCVVVSDGV